MAAGECKEAKGLLEAYVEALNLFHDSQSWFRHAALTRQEALERAWLARKRYWAHVGQHKCRVVAAGTAA